MVAREDYEMISKYDESSSSSEEEEEHSHDGDGNGTMTTSTGKRSHLLILMGFPPEVGDSDYDPDEIEPDWEAVGEYLQKNPNNNAKRDASIAEDGEYPLDDALWIQNYESGPVPAIVIVRLLRLCPRALTKFSFQTASDNPTLSWDVRRLLASADVNSNFTQTRSELVQLMGYPPLAGDNDYDQEHIIPQWDAVRQRLNSHPEEAALDEEGTFPLADALWIESKPVPLDVVILLMEACPESLTDEAFVHAGANEMLIGSNVLRSLFDYSNQILDKDKGKNKDEDDMIILDAEPKGDDETSRAEAEDEIIVPPLVVNSEDDETDKFQADVAMDSEVAIAVDVTDIPEWSKKQFLRYGDVVKIISNTGQACVDIGMDCFLRNTSATESTPTTRLILDGPSNGSNHTRSGPIREGDVFGIYSEDRTLRLDIGKPSMKTMKNSLSCNSWATDLYLAPATALETGEKKFGQIINYGETVGIFSSTMDFRLDIGLDAVCEVAEASRDSWGTHLRVGFLGHAV